MPINPAQAGPAFTHSRVIVDGTVVDLHTPRAADMVTQRAQVNRDQLLLDNPRAELFRTDVMLNAQDSVFGISTPALTSSGSGNIYDILWALLSKFQDGLTQQVKDLEGKYFDASGKLKEGVSEVEVKQAFSELQRLQDLITQLTTTVTNLEKADHESKMAVVRNVGG